MCVCAHMCRGGEGKEKFKGGVTKRKGVKGEEGRRGERQKRQGKGRSRHTSLSRIRFTTTTGSSTQKGGRGGGEGGRSEEEGRGERRR